MIGKRFGHYAIVGQLGRGGMASVFKAEQLGLERPVALKILHASLTADDTLVQRFQQEARIAANLHHPHIVTIYDVGEADGVFYIAMRYIEGENLGQLLRREGALAPERALRMVEQVADALDYAHARGILHRDIKPANVMVEPGDALTLTDFGIARAGEQSHLTATRMVIGTPEYMSPEQARGEPLDKRSDLYALGVLMYEALGGRPPFSAASTPSLLYLHVHEPPPPLHEIRPDLPSALSDVLDKALAKDPASRFQSGREMMAGVRAALATLAHEPQTAETEISPSGRPSRPDAPRARGEGLSPVVPGQPAPSRGTPPPPRAQPNTQRPTPAPPLTSPRGQPAVRAGQTSQMAQTLTPPPATGGAGGAAAVVQSGSSTDTGGSSTKLIGPLVAILALLVVGGLGAWQFGLFGDRTTVTPTPTAVAAKPTTPPTPVQQAAGPTAAPAKPTEVPATPAPVTATSAPPTSTAAPLTATPSAQQRVQAAQAAVAAGNFQQAIDQLQTLKADSAVKADKNTASTVDETLRKTYVAYGNQLLDQERLDDAWAQFGEALKMAPNDPEATDGQKRVTLTKNYAVMEANWGKDDEAAINALEANMKLDPDFRDTREKLYALLIGKADRLLNGGKRDDAYSVLMHALEVVPKGAEARQRLASYTPTPTPIPPTPVPAPPPPRPQPQPQPQPRPQPQPQPERPFVPPGAPV
ncbi:MAG: protein kinase [Chloroflexi bacterium]|nr:protein kinase [Chloroflexota bacterium]